MKPSQQSYAAGLLAMLKPTSLTLLLRCWSASRLKALLNDWRAWALPAQLAPEGDWRTWVFFGGRGAGKTRAGAEWVSEAVRRGRARRIALIGPTMHHVREIMVSGPSGLSSIQGERPQVEISRRRLTWSNGSVAYCFSAEEPEALRGPQFDLAWGDEFCFWPRAEETLETLAHGLRLGAQPRLMVTTTPRPIGALSDLLAAGDTVTTRATTWDNRANVAPDFVAALNERWRGTLKQRRELLGELVEDFEGALWRRSELEALRMAEPAPCERVVVAIDPPAAIGAGVATCGIIAAGAYGVRARRNFVVLADASVQGVAPEAWARRAVTLARSVGAHSIVAEANNGGEMVRAVLQAAAPDCAVRLVRASEGKRARAEPVALLYAQGRVRHAAGFPALEDQMCAFGADDMRESPDRVDALVWAITDLLKGGEGPRVSAL